MKKIGKLTDKEWGKLLEKYFIRKAMKAYNKDKISIKPRRRAIFYILDIMGLSETSEASARKIFDGKFDSVRYESMLYLMQDLLVPPEALPFDLVVDIILSGPEKYHNILIDAEFKNFIEINTVKHNPERLQLPTASIQSLAKPEINNPISSIQPLVQRNRWDQILTDRAKFYNTSKLDYIGKIIKEIPKTLKDLSRDADWEEFKPIKDQFPKYIQKEAYELHKADVSDNKVLGILLTMLLLLGSGWGVTHSISSIISNVLIASIILILWIIFSRFHEKANRDTYWTNVIWKTQTDSQEQETSPGD